MRSCASPRCGTAAGRLFTRAPTVIDITARKRAEAEGRRIHADELQAISQRVVEIQETERRSLSAELHDRLGQDLAAINLNLHIIRDQFPRDRGPKSGRGWTIPSRWSNVRSKPCATWPARCVLWFSTIMDSR